MIVTRGVSGYFEKDICRFYALEMKIQKLSAAPPCAQAVPSDSTYEDFNFPLSLTFLFFPLKYMLF